MKSSPAIRFAATTIAAFVVSACAPAAPPPSRLPASALPDTVRGERLTVIFFFSADCPVQRAHDARLRALFDRYARRGVAFVAVDSEVTATPEHDRGEASARGYPFPILSDPRGALADALGATWATYTVVVDTSGVIRYRGGVDSDRAHLTSDARLWLRDAIDRLLEGRAPDPAETTSLGCALRRR